MEQQTQQKKKTTIKGKSLFDITESKVMGSEGVEQINESEQDRVHFYATDYASPQPTMPNELFKPDRKLCKLTEGDFVRAFATNYARDGYYDETECDTPQKIVDILKSVNMDMIREVCENELRAEPTRQAANKRAERLLNEFSKLVTGSLVVKIEDIIHIPNN